MTMRPIILAMVGICALAGCQEKKADTEIASSYAKQFAIEPAQNVSLHRLTLTPEVIAASQQNRLQDIRIFDGNGRVVPFAYLPASLLRNSRVQNVPIFPIEGPVSPANANGLDIEIQQHNGRQSVRVQGAASTVSPQLANNAMLLDTSNIKDPIDEIVLDVTIPTGLAIEITLKSSTNLKDWHKLGAITLFRTDGQGTLLQRPALSLDHINLAKQYILASWGDSQGVSIQSANVISSDTAPNNLIPISATGLRLKSAHEVNFSLANHAMPDEIELSSLPTDGVLPVEFLVEVSGENPWQLLSAGTLQPQNGPTTLNTRHGIGLGNYQIRVDGRTAGFSQAPTMRLLFQPIDLLIAFNNTPPYRLAVGNQDALIHVLPITEIAPQLTDAHSLPVAQLAPSGGAAPILNLSPNDTHKNKRIWLLWASLILGVAILGLMVFKLLTSTKTQATHT